MRKRNTILKTNHKELIRMQTDKENRTATPEVPETESVPVPTDVPDGVPDKRSDKRSEKKEKKPGKKKKAGKIIRRVIVTVLILAILAGAGLYAWNRLKGEYTVTYQPYTATLGSISNSLSFSGTLQTVNSQDATANSSTTVRTLYVREGDSVKKGARLARLANGQTLEAETDGTVNQVYYAEGDSVPAGNTVIQVIDFGHMKTSIRVDEYDIGEVHTGDACRITITATERTFTSEIASINHTSSSGGNVAYYTATAYVDVDAGCYPGMQVTVTVPQEEATDVVILKADAISFDAENKAFVYVKDEADQVSQQYITTGVSNGNYVEITSGLASGDTVYTVKKVENSTSSGFLAGIFGGQNFLDGGGMPGSRNFEMPNGGNFDFSNFGGGQGGGFGGGQGGRSNDGSGGGNNGGRRNGN